MNLDKYTTIFKQEMTFKMPFPFWFILAPRAIVPGRDFYQKLQFHIYGELCGTSKSYLYTMGEI